MPTTATRTRWALRPGHPVLRRDPDTLQVGLVPPRSVRLPDRPAVRDLLSALVARRDPGPLDPEAEVALSALMAAGLVLDRAYDAGPPPDEPDLALFGTDAARRRAVRGAVPVGVRGDALAGLDALLGSAGLVRDDERAVVWLVVSAGVTSRDALDPLMRAGTPHLVVEGVGGARRLGPFVEPGRTACLRCVDAHEAATDPRLPFLLDQAAASAAAYPPPVDPVLDRLAAAWAVRDLTRYAEGDQPSTWSATVTVGATDAPALTRWRRHPQCGCAWDVIVDLP